MAKPVNIPVTADTKKAQNAFKELEMGAKNLGTSLGGAGQLFGKFAQMGAGTAILGGAAATLRDAATAAMEDQQSSATLATTLKNVTGATEDQLKATEDYILKLEMASGVADDKLRPAYSNLVVATKSAAEAQDLMGIAMDTAQGRGLDLETVSKALAKAHDGNTGALSKLGIATKDAEGKALTYDQILKNLATTYSGAVSANADTAAGKQAILALKFTELKETIGSTLLPVLTTLGDFIGQLVGWFQSLSPGLQQAIMLGGLLTAALAGVGLIIAPLITSIAAIVPMISAMGLTFGAIAAPVAIAVAAIGAIIAIVIVCIKYHEEIRAALIKAWDAIKSAVSAAWTAIKGAVSSGLNAVKSAVSSGMAAVQGFFSGAWNAIKGVFTSAWNAIKSAVTTGLELVKTGVMVAMAAVKKKFTDVWSDIKAVFSNALTAISDLIGNAAGWLKEKAQAVADAVMGPFKWLADKLVGHSVVPDMVTAILEEFTKLDDKSREKISVMATAIQDKFGRISDLVKGAYEKMREAALAVLDKERDQINAHYDKRLSDLAKYYDERTRIVDEEASAEIAKLNGQLALLDKQEQELQDARAAADRAAITDPGQRAKAEAAWQEELRKRELQAKKDAIREQIDAVRDKATETKESLKQEEADAIAAIQAQKDEDLKAWQERKDAVEGYFAKLTTDASIAYRTLKVLGDQYTGEQKTMLDKLYGQWSSYFANVAAEEAKVSGYFVGSSSAGVAQTGAAPGPTTNNNQKTIIVNVSGAANTGLGREMVSALAGAGV